MKRILICLCLLLAVTTFAEAKYRQVCIAQYQTQYGWSKKYEVEVTFMTGFELNQATGSMRYKSTAVYAIIFWGQGQASVIQLSNFLLCGYEVDRACIVNSIGDLKGTDQDGDEWKICKDSFCF